MFITYTKIASAVTKVAFFTLALLLGSSPSLASLIQADDFFLQTIQNKTGGNVNDLVLDFTSDAGPTPEIRQARIQNVTSGEVGEGAPTGTQGDDFNFAQGTFGTIANNDFARIRFDTSVGTARINVLESRWTFEGAPIPGDAGRPFTIPGSKPGTITREQFMASVRFENTGTEILTYSNLRLYTGNSLANFNLDDFDTPTGTLVGEPFGFFLNPGESRTVSFGDVSTGGYELALINVGILGDPTVLPMASGSAVAVIPEPSAISLLVIGAAGLLSYGHRLSRRRSQPRV